jgi:hypothetical protein
MFALDYCDLSSRRYDPFISITVISIWPLVLVYAVLFILKRVAGVPAPIENPDLGEKARQHRIAWTGRFRNIFVFAAMYLLIFRWMLPELEDQQWGRLVD